MHRRRFLATLAALPVAAWAASRVTPAADTATPLCHISGLQALENDGTYQPCWHGIPRDVTAMQMRMNALESQLLTVVEHGSGFC